MSLHTKHFLTLARIAHRRGMQLRKAGLPAQAFARFVERDIQLERARG